MLKTISITGAFVASLILMGCPSDKQTPSDAFDRKAMLADVADALIIPAYAQVDSANVVLRNAVDQFTAQPAEPLLSECRNAWKVCVFLWQRASPYNFGPAEGLYGNLRENIATFPANADSIEGYIVAADTSLQNFNRDTRGYYGIDYLLFSGDITSVTQRFQDDVNRRAYLRAIVRDVEQRVSTVYSTWASAYRSEFISRNGTDAGSSTSLLFNHMNMSYELAKNYKVSLPLGRVAGQTQIEPGKVEAYYSGYSIALLKEHYVTIMRIWRGETADGANIVGFKEYLESVPGGDRLIVDTEMQTDSVSIALQSLSDDESLSAIIINQPDRLEPLYAGMQKFTRFIKSELSSLIGIAITYSSGDGD